MKFAALLASAAMLAFAQPALATTTFVGSADIVDIHSADPGLMVFADPIAFGPFSLNIGQSHTFNALTIGTTEDYVNLGEDTRSYDIEVGFDFTNPAGATGGTISGTTRGIWQLFGNGYGKVTWDNSTVFNFGNGGSFSLQLFDTTFPADGSATVSGKIKLLSEPAVPEPASWAMMLVGFGALGLAMRRRKIAVSFA